MNPTTVRNAWGVKLQNQLAQAEAAMKQPVEVKKEPETLPEPTSKKKKKSKKN